MIKTLLAADRSERERFKIPRSVQQSIPVQRIYRDGIWQTGGKFSRTWRFADINYALASHDDQHNMFTSYCGVLNSLPTDATTKITINNRRLNGADFRRSILMRERGDGLDMYRQEYNRVLTDKAAESNDLIQDKYITVSVARKNFEEARTFFHRVDADLGKNFGRLESGARALDNQERLRIFHDFFRPGEEEHFRFDLSDAMKKGHDFRDYICPDGLCFKADHFELGGKVGRVLFLRDYASYIKDEMISKLSDFPRNLMLSIDILPIPTDEAIREVQSRILGIEADIARWQQRQNSRNNFTASIPYELEQLRAETKEFLDDLSTRDQRMIFANVTIVHMADTLEQLDADTETLQAIGLEQACQFSILRYQQEDGLNTALPYGLRRIKTTRTLTTESTAVLMPFRVQEIQDAGGIYYGVNAVSKNLLICNRKKLLNPHGFVLGVSGSGKSFFTNHLVRQYYEQGAHILLVDTGNSYQGLCRMIHDRTNGKDGIYITYEEDNPISFNPFYTESGKFDVEKRDSINTLILTLWKREDESPKRSEEVALSGAVNAYIRKISENRNIRPDFNGFYEFVADDYRRMIEEKKVREKDFDIDGFLNVLEPFYRGGDYDFLLNSDKELDLTGKRFIVFELDNISSNKVLLPVVTLIIMETFIAKMRRLKGIRKMILIEECWKALMSANMSEYIKYLFKTVRKYFGEAVVVTQEVDDIISSPIVKEAIINNSDCKILLDQRKYMNKFEHIQRLLGLTEKEKGQILSINQANHPGRFYREVWIGLGGTCSAVYATEVSEEEYFTFTTEESEKLEVQRIAGGPEGSLEGAIRRLAEKKREEQKQVSNPK